MKIASCQENSWGILLMFDSRKKKIILGSAFAVLVNASLFVSLLSLTVSWFTSKKITSAEASGLIVGDDSGKTIVELDAFKYDLDLGAGHKLDSSVTNDYKMNSHDTIFTANNEWTPMILRLKLKNPDYHEGDGLTVTMNHNTAYDKVDSSVGLSPYISSALGVKCAIVPTSESKGQSYDPNNILIESQNGADENDVYMSAKNYFESGNGQPIEEKTFVTETVDYEEQGSPITTYSEPAVKDGTTPTHSEGSKRTSVNFSQTTGSDSSTTYSPTPVITGSKEQGFVIETYEGSFSTTQGSGFFIKSGGYYLSMEGSSVTAVTDIAKATAVNFTRSGSSYIISGN